MDVEVLHAGMFTTVQDLGRSDFQQSVYLLAGLWIKMHIRMINMLVGNAGE